VTMGNVDNDDLSDDGGNRLEANGGLQLVNDTAHMLAAQNNDWGVDDAEVMRELIRGPVDVEPTGAHLDMWWLEVPRPDDKWREEWTPDEVRGDALCEWMVRRRHREGVLQVSPVSRDEPFGLAREVTLAADRRHVLRIGVSAQEDCVVRALLDQEVVGTAVVHKRETWREVCFDLTKYAGRRATLRVENAAGGERPWFLEDAYVDYVGLVTAERE